MTIIGTALAALAVLTLALCALADPVLLSRVGGRPAEDDGGRHLRLQPEPAAPRTIAPAQIQHDRLAA